MSACGNDEEATQETEESEEVVEEETSIEESDNVEEETDSEEETEESYSENEQEQEGQVPAESTEEDPLAEYSDQEIEYARVWLTVVGPEIEQLETIYFEELPEGTPVLFDDEQGPSYPETVHRLSGERGPDGSVVYSGNGDGTINVYMDRSHATEVVEDFSQEMVEETTLVEVDVHEDEQVRETIELLADYEEAYGEISE